MTVRIAIDLNVRVRREFPGFEPGTVTRARSGNADGAVAVGDKVLAVADDIIGDAEVIGEQMIGDPPYRIAYLAVDWRSFRDDPDMTRGTGPTSPSRGRSGTREGQRARMIVRVPSGGPAASCRRGDNGRTEVCDGGRTTGPTALSLSVPHRP